MWHYRQSQTGLQNHSKHSNILTHTGNKDRKKKKNHHVVVVRCYMSKSVSSLLAFSFCFGILSWPFQPTLCPFRFVSKSTLNQLCHFPVLIKQSACFHTHLLQKIELVWKNNSDRPWSLSIWLPLWLVICHLGRKIWYPNKMCVEHFSGNSWAKNNQRRKVENLAAAFNLGQLLLRGLHLEVGSKMAKK